MREGRWRRVVIGLVAAILLVQLWECGGAETGADVEAAFQEANRLFEQGEYASAIGAYERLLADGQGSAAVYFNLGNAWFKSGRVGKAIWHYRTARDLSPRDADVRANLQFARDLVGEPVREGRLERWIGLLTVDEWAAVSVVLFWSWLGVLMIGQARGRGWRSLGLWVWLMMMAWVVTVVALGIGLLGRHGKQTAIVVAEGEVRYGPFAESQMRFAVRDGVEMEVIDVREGWVQVEDSRRGSGWMERSRVVLHPGEMNGARRGPGN
jgi:hypothetical protein